MHLIRKSFTLETAHQLESAVTAACHECVHGHSYTVELVVGSDDLNADGMVVDFAELGPFKKQVMDKWDHGLLLHKDKKPHYQPLIDAGVLKASKVNFLDDNPTAEVMARILFWDLDAFIMKVLNLHTVHVDEVRVHETSTGWASYRIRR